MPPKHRRNTRTRAPGRAFPHASAAGAALLLCVPLGCASGGNEPVSAPRGPGGVMPADSNATDELNRRISLAAARAATTGRDDLYAIGPADQLAIGVFAADAFTGTYRVNGAGEISMPLIGEVHVAGQTPSSVERTLEERLAERYMRNPNVTVEIAEVQSRGVSVIGAVTTPGVYQIRGRTSLLEVLAMAGGLSETAGSRVMIAPAGTAGLEGDTAGAGLAPAGMPAAGEILEVNLHGLLESGGAGLVVHPGDVVQVPPAQLVYVAGEVNRPGGFTLTGGEPITVLQAVALAEGVGRTAASGRSVIVRQREDGSKEEIPVDLEAVLEGEEAAPLLQPSDVLFIPNNQTKSVALGVINAFVRMFTFRGLIY